MPDPNQQETINHQLESTELLQGGFEAVMGAFDDDEPIEAQCDLENPEICESCT